MAVEREREPRKRSRSRSQRPRSRSQPRGRDKPAARESRRARSRSASSADGGKRGADSGLPLEVQAALLDVDNAALKAENVALKRKLAEAVKSLRSLGDSKPAEAPIRQRKRSPTPKEKVRNNSKPRSSDDRKRSRSPARTTRLRSRSPRQDRPADKASSKEAPVARAASPAKKAPVVRAASPAKKSPVVRAVSPARETPAVRTASPAKDAPVTQTQSTNPDNADKKNAVMLANDAMEIYNNTPPTVAQGMPDKERLPILEKQLADFLDNFDAKIQVLDLKTGGPILKSRKMFTARYTCVFHKSGVNLEGTVNKRFYYDADGDKPTYCLDFETHDSLVTAAAGTPPDGKLGVKDPRTEHLIVLYEEKDGKITRVWLRPDADKLGLDAAALESDICQKDAFKAFEAKIAELRGGKAGKYFFQNYLDTPAIG